MTDNEIRDIVNKQLKPIIEYIERQKMQAINFREVTFENPNLPTEISEQITKIWLDSCEKMDFDNLNPLQQNVILGSFLHNLKEQK